MRQVEVPLRIIRSDQRLIGNAVLVFYRSSPAAPRLTYLELSSFDSRPFELRYQTFAARANDAIGRFFLKTIPRIRNQVCDRVSHQQLHLVTQLFM